MDEQFSGDQQQLQAAKQQQENEARRVMMIQSIMTNEARERLSRIALVRPTQAREVENMILRMAQGGKLDKKVDEDMIKQFLEQVDEGNQKAQPKITIQRKKYAGDDDDDDDYSDL